MPDNIFKVLATRCCHTATCPTIMESGDDIVVVGSAASALLKAAAVREKVGVDEAAVVIPKSLLLEAMKAAG